MATKKFTKAGVILSLKKRIDNARWNLAHLPLTKSRADAYDVEIAVTESILSEIREMNVS